MDISEIMDCGRWVSIIGDAGSGKTTLKDLMIASGSYETIHSVDRYNILEPMEALIERKVDLVVVDEYDRFNLCRSHIEAIENLFYYLVLNDRAKIVTTHQARTFAPYSKKVVKSTKVYLGREALRVGEGAFPDTSYDSLRNLLQSQERPCIALTPVEPELVFIPTKVFN